MLSEDREREYQVLASVLGRKLREARTHRGITLSSLAKELGTSKLSLSRLEVRPDVAKIDAQIRALLALGVSRRELGLAIAVSDDRNPLPRFAFILEEAEIRY